MYLPNFVSEQPGATYYYSPLNVFPFGIVDGSTVPTQLTAMVFYKGEGKKGGNSVASMLRKHFRMQGLLDGRTAIDQSSVRQLHWAEQKSNDHKNALLHS